MKKRRQFTSEFKAKVAIEILSGNKALAEICSRYEIHPTQGKKWKKEAQTILEQGFSNGGANGKLAELEAQNEELFKQLGQLKYEFEWLKKKHKLLNTS